ncbi:MAG: FAD:protein FMN transferase [Oscillochloridaceae bacterium]|nr:FAD:protein FMN transferase [Chloroflexaceae bacterium]MDW8388760.1 FAD:protein FMN transferase [Oscillochloridaceae bacterium]
MVTFSFRAMGSQILVILEAPDPIARPALASLPGVFASWEAILSRFRPDSELSCLNSSRREWLVISPTLAEALALALRGAAATDGLVTPLVLEALEHAGYDRDFSIVASGASPAAATLARPVADWRRIRVDPLHGSVDRPPGLRLDLGGVAKGWAADRAIRLIARHGPALVDVGGDIAVSGPRRDGAAWPIGVQDPRGSADPLAVLRIASGGVATSGRDYRRWRQGDMERHHIIDPRTGAPAETDLLSVTVVAASAADAEIAAKAALILGSAAGLSWLDARPWLAGLLVRDDGAVLHTPTLEALLWKRA